MVHSAHIITYSAEISCEDTHANPSRFLFPTELVPNDCESFDIKIRFSKPIASFRNHDYTWIKPFNGFVAGPFSPKIIGFADGTFAQANQNSGYWEMSGDDAHILLWRFNPKDSAPLTLYSAPSNSRVIGLASAKAFVGNPALLFVKEPIEFSRSEKPFSAVACFTDHCDFDTPENLVPQRELFARTGVKVTKGFFRNHYSKREDNASYERNQDEIERWRNDGHELAYHSLTQSIRETTDAMHEFKNFAAPQDVTTWIDHGYQPYNFSLFRNFGLSDDEYADIVSSKGIEVLWNYIDSGTTSKGIINQLNPNDFTLKKFVQAHHNMPVQKRMGLIIKNVLFHFYGEEKLVNAYKSTAGNFKKVVFNRQFKMAMPLLRSFFGVSKPLAKVFVNWKADSKKTYPLAKYSPLVFRHKIGNKTFHVFQTLDMIDFKQSLSASNLEKLIREKGIFIAHTYFSAPFSYHYGRMLETPTTVNPQVETNFSLLGNHIKSGDIWNPTLRELVAHLSEFEQILLEVDDSGEIIIQNHANLPYRKIA